MYLGNLQHRGWPGWGASFLRFGTFAVSGPHARRELPRFRFLLCRVQRVAVTFVARNFLLLCVSSCVAASIFVEFETKESADKAVEQSEQYNHDGETITVNARPYTKCFVFC